MARLFNAARAMFGPPGIFKWEGLSTHCVNYYTHGFCFIAEIFSECAYDLYTCRPTYICL